MTHIADNHDALLDYLYEEGDAAERLAVATHLQECASCSVAVLEFQNVRGMLSGWTPPAAALGFRIVRDGSSEAPPPARHGWRRAWSPRGLAQAAAAIVVFAAGMAVSQLDVNYGDGALTVRTQSVAPNVRTTSITLPAQAGAGQSVSPDELERLRSLLDSGDPSPLDTERLLQRVRAMIDQSEQRQQRELALRLSQVAREVDTQHRADLLKIQQDFGQQQEATMEYLVQTSGGVK
jgi:anti-sigma factor RsiW